MQDETGTPSSLSMIALAVAAGELPFDDAVLRALRNTSMARHCAAACPYGHDIVGIIDAFVAERGGDPQSVAGG